MNVVFLENFFVSISVVLMLGSMYPYIRDIYKKTTKPDLVSWAGWALLSGIATAAQFAEGASYSVVVPLLSTLGNLTILVLGFRIGHSKFTHLDTLCFGLGLGTIFLWMITSDPVLALYMAALADFVVSVPTIVKAYKKPKSETPSAYFLFAAGSVFGLLASSNAEAQNVIYPLYLTFNNILIGAFALHRKSKKAKVA
jgi:hypothetical protein